MSWCGCVCNVVEDVVDTVVDTAEDVVDTVVDAVEDAVDAVGDFFEDVGEWVEEAITDVGEFVAEVATAVWDWISETGDKVWDWIKARAGDVWEWATGALEDAWDWVKDTASTAWDWVKNAADTVWGALVTAAEAVAQFVADKVVPFLLDTLWVLTHIDDFIVAGLLGIYCLVTGQDEKEYDVIEGMFRLDEEVLAKRKVTYLPLDRRYVVVSDIHMFVSGDPLEKFREIGNSELYQAVLATYAAAGYTLVENGDIEDLWMRETTLGAAFMDVACEVLGWPFGEITEDEYEDARVRSQAVKIFDSNADVYQTIRALFHDKGRFVRLAGNHDDYWRSDDYLPGLQIVYPGLKVHDYAFIGDYGADPRVHGGRSPRIIIAHGHQVDAWNNSVCRDAGAAITAAASGIPGLAASVTKREKWEAALRGSGFENELGEDMLSIDELEFYENIESDFSNQPYVPHFVLGHTHAARHDAEIPNWMFRHEWNFSEYTNESTAGRWEEFIWCVTVENGQVFLRGWTVAADGGLRGYTFRRGGPDRLVAA